MAIRLVTDSAADISPELAARHEISVVPAFIHVGDRSYVDGVDLSREAFYAALPDYTRPPTTAAAAAGTFTALYDRLAAAGATDIISIHIDAGLSNFYNAARVGAEATGAVQVHLFDSRQLTMGTGLQVLKAAEAVAAGQSVSEVMRRLEKWRARVRVYAFLDTLEYLRRSGRVNRLVAGLGALLQIKPVLEVDQGDIRLLDRVRTRKRLLERAQALAGALGPLERLVLLHTGAPELAQGLREQLRPLLPAGQAVPIMTITPAIAAHVGPGAIGFACLLAEETT